MKFKIKEGATKTKAPKTNVDAAARDSLDKEVDAKLAALMGEKPQEIVQAVPSLAKKEETKTALPKLPALPKPGAAPAVKLDIKEKLLQLSDTDAAAFEVMAAAFNQRKALENQLKGENEADRHKILGTMGDKTKYIGKKVDVNVASVKNEYVNTDLVISAIFTEEETLESLKAGLAQMRDLARLGIIETKKGDFEKWLKTAGVDSTPFIKKGDPTLRLTVKAKIQL